MTRRSHGRRPGGGCRHEDMETHQVGGVVRSVCRSCGHVSFDLRPLDDRAIDRSRFARRADAPVPSKPSGD